MNLRLDLAAQQWQSVFLQDEIGIKYIIKGVQINQSDILLLSQYSRNTYKLRVEFFINSSSEIRGIKK